MDFWIIKVKAGKRKSLNHEEGTILMLSEVSPCASKEDNKRKRNQPISLFAEVGDRKFVLGSLSTENIRTMYFRLSYQGEEQIKLSHDWPHGAVKFRGYKLNPSSKTEEEKEIFFQVLSRFPVEIYSEILSWLPVECLLRFKCVCKQWYSLIEESYFLSKQLARTKSTTICSGDAKILDVYAGLIMEKNKYSGRYQIRNPYTRRILDLPDPPKGSFFKSLCGNIDKFAAVALYAEKADKNTEGCAILKFGKDKQWRLLKLPNAEECGSKVEDSLLHPDRRITYFVKLNEDGLNYYMYVYALDLESESFSRTILPGGIFSNLRKARPLCWKNRLGIYEIVKEQLNVLCLEDYKKMKWSENKITVPLTFLKDNDYWKDVGDLNLYGAGSDELHFSYKKKYFTYNMVLGKITSDKPWCVILPGLITLSGMRPEQIYI